LPISCARATSDKAGRGMERKLTAILSADVQGYSRLMGEAEEATLRTLTSHRQLIDSQIAHHRGRIVGTAGDSVLAEFASVVAAVQCAVVIQQTLKAENAQLPAARQMEFRIGINLGEVMVEGDQIYGDGVNIAARLEALAEAGGICLSGIVHEQVKHKLALHYEDLGEQAVKNIAEPVRVWRTVMDDAATALVEQVMLRHAPHEREQAAVTLSPKNRRWGPAHRPWVVGGVGVLLLVTGTLIARWYHARLPLSPQSAVRSSEPAPAALPLPDKPSIVVLPFVNMSEDPKQEYFSDGLTEDLTSDLSKISSLFVIARNSAFTYKGKAVKVQDVSKELGVRYVLEGSVRKADNQVRITVQLIDATTGGHLWSERYDRSLAPRPVDVWLPPHYQDTPSRRFPVLYMHDGQNLFDPQTSFLGVDWGIDEAMRGLTTAGRARAAIVVGIWNTPQRSQEYMPQRPLERICAKRRAKVVNL
jgi:adenylate cyclase